MKQFLIGTSIFALLMVSTATASIIATPNPAIVTSSNVSGGMLTSPETVNISFKLQHTNSAAIDITSIGGFAMSGLSAAGSSPMPTFSNVSLITSGTLVNRVQPMAAGVFSFGVADTLPGGTGAKPYQVAGVSIAPNVPELFAQLTVTLPTGWIVGDSVNISYTEPVIFEALNGGGDLTADFDLISGAAGSVSVLTAIAVPEPNSFLMIGLVGVGMVGIRRFRRMEVLS